MSEKIQLTSLERSRFPDERSQSVIRFCPKCGREIPVEQSVCAFCENSGSISRPPHSRFKRVLLIVCLVLVFFLLLTGALFVTRKTGLRF